MVGGVQYLHGRTSLRAVFFTLVLLPCLFTRARGAQMGRANSSQGAVTQGGAASLLGLPAASASQGPPAPVSSADACPTVLLV